MAIKAILIEEANSQQLRSFAALSNLDVPDNASDAEVRSAIERAQPGIANIYVEVADNTPAPASAFEEGGAGDAPLRPEEGHGRMAGSLGKGDPRAIIEIQVIETDDGKGAEDVFVGVNGRGWQLRRGIPISVPWRVVLALDAAEQNIVRHRQDEGHEGEVMERKAKRFPYIFHERPSQAEIAAWHERTDKVFAA